MPLSFATPHIIFILCTTKYFVQVFLYLPKYFWKSKHCEHRQTLKDFKMSNQARSHDDNRKIVCMLCMKKCTRHLIETLIKKKIIAGINLKQAKKFGNVICDPIVTGPSNTLILELIPLIELHLLLSVVNHLFRVMKDAWPKTQQWHSIFRKNHTMEVNLVAINFTHC